MYGCSLLAADLVSEEGIGCPGTAVIDGVNCHVGVGNQSSVLYSQY